MKKANGPSTTYAVGRGKPPEHTRFKPGQSGNPKGRRRGSRSLRTDVKEALQMPIVIIEGGKKRRISTQIGTVLKLREKALRGDGRALDRLLELAARYNDEPIPPSVDEPLSDDDEAILADYRARHAGLDAPKISGASKSEADNPEHATGSSSAGKRSIRRRRSRRRQPETGRQVQ